MLDENTDVELDDTDLVEIVKDEIYQADTVSEIREEISACDIKYIEPNYVIELCDEYIPNDARYLESRWAQDIMNVQEVWERGYFGNYSNSSDAPVVGVIDTGLAGSGKNPVCAKHEDINYLNVLSGESYVLEKTDTDDGVGHGTFVTGIIAAQMNNGVGIAGNMPNVKIRPYKCFDSLRNGSVGTEISCINKAIEDKVDVINISAGGLNKSKIEREAIENAINSGIIVCAAAGNNGNGGYCYPASYDGVVSVSSINSSENRSSYSQYNDRITVAAPGDQILGLKNTNPIEYLTKKGTSFSCPQVTALAAMCKSIDPTIDQYRFRELLKSTSRDIGTAGYDTYYGWGIIDYGNMLDALVPEENSIWAAEITGISSNAEYTGNEITFDDLKITMPGGTELSADSDYTVAYYNNTKTGMGMITIRGVGDYTGRINKYFNINKVGGSGRNHGGHTPGSGSTGALKEESSNAEPVKPDPIKVIAPTIKKLAAGKKSFKVTWKKQSADGYQLQYSTSKTFKKSSRKTITISKKKTSYTVKKLKAKKKYYVRMRSYKIADGKRTNSAWTTATSLYIKKK